MRREQEVWEFLLFITYNTANRIPRLTLETNGIKSLYNTLVFLHVAPLVCAHSICEKDDITEKINRKFEHDI